MFVTDTHALIHHVTGRKRRLGRNARATFERSERGVDGILVPFTVLEEIMLLSEAGKVRLSLPFRDLVISLAQADNFDLGINDMQLLLEAASFMALSDPMTVSLLRRRESWAYPSLPAMGRFSNPAWFVLCGINKPS